MTSLALECYKITDEARKQYVINKIKLAAENRNYAVNFYKEEIIGNVKTYLEENGFKVYDYTDNYQDPKYRVSWLHAGILEEKEQQKQKEEQ